MDAKGQGGGSDKPGTFKKGDPRAGRRKGQINKATAEVREAAKGLVEDPAYRRKLQARMRKGDISPPVETMLWHYAYGKPKEKIELSGADGGPVQFQEERGVINARLEAMLKAATAKREEPPAEG